MRIGLLSDTHSWLDPRMRTHFAECDEIWHAGDIGTEAVADELESWKPVRAVWGNIDGTELRKRYKEHYRAKVEGLDVWMTHIGGRPPRYDRSVTEELLLNPPGLFICGHSHICLVQYDQKLRCLYMNPGAAGKHGWHQMRTILRFTIEAGSPKDLELIELGPRGTM